MSARTIVITLSHRGEPAVVRVSRRFRGGILLDRAFRPPRPDLVATKWDELSDDQIRKL